MYSSAMKMFIAWFFGFFSITSFRMVVLTPEERAPDDFVERESDDAGVEADDLEEIVVTVDAGEAPAADTLTFMRFGVV